MKYEKKIPGDILTTVNSENLIWIWQNKTVKLNDLDNTRLNYIAKMLPKQAMKNNVFWNGVHYIGYIRAIECILEKRMKSKITIPTKLKSNAKEVSHVLYKTDRFLGELDKTFHKSKLSKQIAQQTREQIKQTNK